MLQFTSSGAMNKFFSIVENLFFIISVPKVLRQNALFGRTYTLHSQVPGMFDFFSQMARKGLIESYSAARLYSGSRVMQTTSSEAFDDQKKEWIWDTHDFLTRLKSIHDEIQAQYIGFI